MEYMDVQGENFLRAIPRGLDVGMLTKPTKPQTMILFNKWRFIKINSTNIWRLWLFWLKYDRSNFTTAMPFTKFREIWIELHKCFDCVRRLTV